VVVKKEAAPPVAPVVPPKLETLAEDEETKVTSPQPIRLPTKSKSKPDSDSDSDGSRSTKSSASSSSKVARVFKKTFKGKAIAIVKPFSNPAPEKKTPEKKVEPAGDEYEFGDDEVTGGEGSSRGKPVKRLKRGGNLKAVRVRVEKLQGKKRSQ